MVWVDSDGMMALFDLNDEDADVGGGNGPVVGPVDGGGAGPDFGGAHGYLQFSSDGSDGVDTQVVVESWFGPDELVSLSLTMTKLANWEVANSQDVAIIDEVEGVAQTLMTCSPSEFNEALGYNVPGSCTAGTLTTNTTDYPSSILKPTPWFSTYSSATVAVELG